MNNFIRKYANIPNPITKIFNKIDICKLYGDRSKKVELLKAMKKVPLYAKCIEICSNNAEELENLTDPNLHITPINNLKLRLCDSVKISSKIIKNLQSIYPNSITLSDDSDNQDEASHQSLFENFIKLLSKLNQTSLEMDFDKNYHSFKLEFNDAILKVVESKEECSYIRAKSVEIRCADEELCWIK